MQLVKEYKFIMGDKRFERETKTIVEQINEDLINNTNWTIYLLTPISSEEIIVVYDVKEYAERNIKLLNEELKTVTIDKQPELLNKTSSTTI